MSRSAGARRIPRLEGTHIMRFGWRARLSTLIVAVALAGASEARGQDAPPIAVEATAGWAGFVDDATKHHAVYGGGARVPLTPRISVGPEVAYMVGPDGDRDLFVLGSLWFDLLSPDGAPPVTPYVVVGGGYMAHRDATGRGRYAWSHEGAFTAGGGARVRIGDRVYVGGDVRIGWELHLRTTAHVGVTWPRR